MSRRLDPRGVVFALALAVGFTPTPTEAQTPEPTEESIGAALVGTWIAEYESPFVGGMVEQVWVFSEGNGFQETTDGDEGPRGGYHITDLEPDGWFALQTLSLQEVGRVHATFECRLETPDRLSCPQLGLEVVYVRQD